MRTVAALILLMTLALGGGQARAAEPNSDGTDRALQTHMQRLFELRTQDPQTFVAEVRALEDRPPPANVAQREYLQFLQAYRTALEGRFADAIALAKPLAESAEDRALRLRAAAYVVNLRAGTREFDVGLRELGQALQTASTLESTDDPLLREGIAEVWRVAAVFYSELDKPQLSRWYARRILDNHPSPRNACAASMFDVKARRGTADLTLQDSDFLAVDAICERANESSILGAFNTIEQTRFLRDRERLDAALALMAARLGQVEGTRYPRLVAEAYALDAEMLLAAGRTASAERQARHALEVAKDTPTSLPVAMAEKVLYEIHRRRGDS
ncbi:MAG: hypothetical protein ACRC2H_13390, partial [Silanimonas sp.]